MSHNDRSSIGLSELIQQVKQDLLSVAPGKVSVLIQGASETNPDNPDLLQFLSSL
jgi:DNA-binding NtrC family response regulator